MGFKVSQNDNLRLYELNMVWQANVFFRSTLYAVYKAP